MAYTTIEQSKKIVELGLSFSTADMCYSRELYLGESEYPVVIAEGFKVDWTKALPCWSLAALLGVLPVGIIGKSYVPNIQKENGKYSIAYGDEELLCIADNPVDACYEMILKLHEFKML